MVTPGVLQISSIKSQCTQAEWQARIDLAACFRLVHLYGMAGLTADHILSRVPGEASAFLINASDLMFEEITASSLIKVDGDGRMLPTPDSGGLDRSADHAGGVVHGAIFSARPDVGCIIHTHSCATLAVSALECGLLPITQTGMRFLKIGYHDDAGLMHGAGEQALQATALGSGEAVILRNHGVLTVGRTSAEAFNAMHHLELACRAQLAAMAYQVPLVMMAQPVLDTTPSHDQSGGRQPDALREWPALLRKLDRLDPTYRD